MNYSEARDYIRSLIRRGIKYELSKMRRLAELMDHPERRVRWIHVTGTNGKGSTAASLEALLRGAGLKVGLFTSPHLVSMTERFRVDGNEMSEDAFVRMVERLRPAIERMEGEPTGAPTFFEICTAGACVHFLEERVDVAIAEVGLGGRIDATNIIEPELAVITNIGLDHPKTLGPGLEDICRQKCGIVKPKVPLLCGVRQEELKPIVIRACREADAPLHWAWKEFRVSGIEMNERVGTSFTIEFTSGRDGKEADRGSKYRLTTPLLGRHQAVNAAMAVAAARLLPDDLRPGPDTWRSGLAMTRWEGRFQVVGGRPTLVLDGAHNVDGVKALVRTWIDLFPDRKAVVVAGFSGDKTVADMLRLLAPITASIVFTRSANYRAAEPGRLVGLAKDAVPSMGCSVEEEPCKAVKLAAAEAGREGMVLVTGSLYLVGDVLGGLRRGGDGICPGMSC